MIAAMDGGQLLETAQWEAAREAFASALADGESADALDGLGLAMWFLGDLEGGIETRARAFDHYVREDRCDEAARTAAWVSHQHFLAGRASACQLRNPNPIIRFEPITNRIPRL